MTEPDTRLPKQKRGFACLSPERRREIAALGGKAVPDDRRGFSAVPGLAQSAGRLGGRPRAARRDTPD